MSQNTILCKYRLKHVNIISNMSGANQLKPLLFPHVLNTLNTIAFVAVGNTLLLGDNPLIAFLFLRLSENTYHGCRKIWWKANFTTKPLITNVIYDGNEIFSRKLRKLSGISVYLSALPTCSSTCASLYN